MFDLDSLHQTGFTWQTALSLGMASDLVYQRGPAVVNVATRNWHLDECTFLERDGTECFVARTHSAIVVAFRGTESLSDWLADLDVWAITKPYGRVHRGFVNAYQVIADELNQALMSFDPGRKIIHLTGHSLGGALATIAACELRGRFPISSIYTFGQPRLGDRTTSNFFEDHYPRRFHRFVFDDDIVTRVPPGYEHVGQLYHFDAHGFLQQAAVESGETTSEPAELSPSEFAVVKETARAVRDAAQVALPVSVESADALADRSLEGLLPSVWDHRMANYLFALRNQLPRQRDVSNEAILQNSMDALESVRFPVMGAVEPRYPVQVRVRDLTWTPPRGCIANSQVGPIYSLCAERTAIHSMQSDPKIQSLEISREIDLPDLYECAVSVPFVKADVLHTGTVAEKGDQALVGLIDTGLDILHETFLDESGHSRVEAVWVQRSSDWPAPYDVDPDIYTQRYGTLYLAQDIQRFVNDDLVNGNNNTPRALRDPWPSLQTASGHGTHVASIAAGRAVGTFGGGVAPDARLVVVVPYMKTNPPDPPSLGYSNSHQDALAFLLAYKRARGLPMAVNVSLGMNAGAHDGMSLLEKTFDSISLKGKEEGFVIVKSAGNERGHCGHCQVQAAVASVVDIRWNSSNIDRTHDYLEFWYGADDQLKFTLIAPSGARSPRISHNPSERSAQFTSNGNDVYLNLTVHHPDNDDHLLAVRIIPISAAIQQGPWTLEIEAVSLGPTNGIVHGWVERNQSRPVQFLTGVASDDMTLSIPGTAETVISVAATNTSSPLRLHSDSSYGPTRRNGAKPDVNAPGENITAALSDTVDHQAVVTLSGTSMAAPHVTGALALVLSARHKRCLADSAKRQFNAIQLAGVLKRSSRSYTTLHNKGFGYGGLDAAALFREADMA